MAKRIIRKTPKLSPKDTLKEERRHQLDRWHDVMQEANMGIFNRDKISIIMNSLNAIDYEIMRQDYYSIFDETNGKRKQ